LYNSLTQIKNLGLRSLILFINSRSQRGKLCFVLLPLTLEDSQPGAHGFADVFVAPALDLFGDEVVKLVGLNSRSG
jgi:hypothetical protein